MSKNYDENLAEYKQLKKELSSAVDSLIQSKQVALNEKAEYLGALSEILRDSHLSAAPATLVDNLKGKVTKYTPNSVKDTLKYKFYPSIDRNLETVNSETASIKDKAIAKHSILYAIAILMLEFTLNIGTDIGFVGIDSTSGELTMHGVGTGRFINVDIKNKSVTISSKKELFKLSIEEKIKEIALNSPGDISLILTDEYLNYMWENKKELIGAAQSKEGRFIILEISNGNFWGNAYGQITLQDGDKPRWNRLTEKFKFVKQYPQISTFIKNDTDSDDYIYYYEIED